jgi:hypothetical protein
MRNDRNMATRKPLRFRSGRTAAAIVLIVVGALCTLQGVAFLWLNDTIFNSDNFAATAVEAAKAPPVRTEISRILVDEAVKAKPDLLTVRPLLETVVETVVSTPLFKQVLILAVRDLHRGVFNTGERSFALDLSNGLTVAIGHLRIANPQLADQIPPDVTTGLIAFGQGRFVSGLTRTLERIHALMLALGVAGVLLLVAAVVVAGDRRAAITGVGVAISTGALLLVIALIVGRQILVQQIPTASTADAAGSVFDTFTGELRAFLWDVAILGVVLAAAASATVRTEGATGEIGRVRTTIAWLWARPWAKLAAVVGALGLGAALLLAPEVTLGFIARAAGLLLLYVFGAELLRLSGLASTTVRVRRSRAENLQALEHSLLVRLSAIAGLIVLMVAGATALWILHSNLSADDFVEAKAPQGCNGYVELCDRPITQVAFAATHNSQSAAATRGFYFAEQLYDIRSQLNAGVRALLVKSHYGIPTDKGVLTDISRETEEEHRELSRNVGPEGLAAVARLQASFGRPPKDAQAEPYLCHGFCELGAVPLDDTLAQVNEFLIDHPNEVIIIFFGDFISPKDTEDAFIRSGLIDRVYTHEPGTPWPTLRQMIDMDQRVLVLSEHSANLSRPDWYLDGWSVAQDTPFAFKSPADLQSDTSCAENRGTPDAPFFLINHWIPSQTPSQTTAAAVNAYDVLLNRVQRCEQLRNHLPNMVAVDFAEKGDLFRVVDTINGVGQYKPATAAGATATP